MAWAIAAILALLALLWTENSGSQDLASEDHPIPDPSSSDSGVNISAPGDLSTGGNVDAISKFVLGIWKTEGMNPGDRAVRNNNPGNLKFAGQAGAVSDGTADNFAVFKTFQDGWNAAIRQVQLDTTRNPGWTVLMEMRKWLGMVPNGAINVTNQGDALKKAQTVAASVGAGATVNSTLRDLFGV